MRLWYNLTVMKRLLFTAAAAAMLVSVCVLGGCAVGEAHVEYTLSEDGTHYIVSGVTGDIRGLTKLEVPETYGEEGSLLPVTEIGDEAFFRCTRLVEAKIPQTIERIGVRAFARCSFSEFVIPDGVKVIDDGAFGMCDNLKEITVPESVETLAVRAFYACSSLQKAVIKAQITVLDRYTLYNTVPSQGGNVYMHSSLTQIYLPATLEKIEISALYGNPVTDIYFAGSESAWNSLYFYELVEKEGKEDEYEEKVYEKSKVLGSAKVHLNAEF